MKCTRPEDCSMPAYCREKDACRRGVSMTTDTPAAAPTAEQELMERYRRELEIIAVGDVADARAAAEQALIETGFWSGPAALSARVAAQPAASGVDALWVEGEPPAHVEVAWLRLNVYGSDEEGAPEEFQRVVLGVRDNEDGWSESGDWKGESYRESVFAEPASITHWMRYEVPSTALTGAAKD